MQLQFRHTNAKNDSMNAAQNWNAETAVVGIAQM